MITKKDRKELKKRASSPINSNIYLYTKNAFFASGTLLGITLLHQSPSLFSASIAGFFAISTGFVINSTSETINMNKKEIEKIKQEIKQETKAEDINPKRILKKNN